MPNPPTNLVATKQDYRLVLLTWEASVTPAVTYEVQRKAGTGNFVTVSPPLAGTNYTDGGVLPYTQYTYQVIARDSQGQPSVPSNQQTVLMSKITAPTSVTSADAPGPALTVSWAANGDTGLSFDVERRLDPAGSWVLATSTPGYFLSATDMGTPIGQSFYHRVIAKKQIMGAWYYSDPSQQSALRMSIYPLFTFGAALPAAPLGVVAANFTPAPDTTSLTYRHIRLEWKHLGVVTQYLVIRKDLAASRPKDVPPDLEVGAPITFDDWQAFHINTEYTYHIATEDPDSLSEPATTMVLNLLQAPVDVTVSNPDVAQLHLTWKHLHASENGGDVDIRWRIRRYNVTLADYDVDFNEVQATLAADTFEWDDSDAALETGMSYRYEVSAKRDGVLSSAGRSPREGTVVRG